MSCRVVWVQTNGVLELLLSLVVLAAVRIDQPQNGVSIRRRGIQRERFFGSGAREREIFAVGAGGIIGKQNVSGCQARMGGGIGGVFVNRLVEQLRRFLEVLFRALIPSV